MTPVPPPPVPGPPSQVTLKTAFTVCFAVVATVALVFIVLRTPLALSLTVASAMVAVALDHVVQRLARKGWRRSRAVALVLCTLLLLLLLLVLLVVPPAVAQIRALVEQAPSILMRIREAPLLASLDARFGLLEKVRAAAGDSLGLASSAVSPVLSAIGSVLSGVAGLLSALALTTFMLVFGGELLRRLTSLATPDNRVRYERILAKTYASVGGYLGGLLLICSTNAVLTTTFLALSRTPFFLPLGLLSGFSSLVPYAGPVIVGAFVTLVALATGGLLKGGITVLYFLLYGQLEGNVLGPFVFRRTVHLDPLVTFLAILFLAELLGIVGAVIAVPAVAMAQIIARELLLMRHERRLGVLTQPTDAAAAPPPPPPTAR